LNKLASTSAESLRPKGSKMKSMMGKYKKRKIQQKHIKILTMKHIIYRSKNKAVFGVGSIR